ncbi:MAG: spore coat associated protein CotJA [Lachnospiraceae bacterium]|nr:spore coat associated protein CotJA [Lachnospiraceae bacterium]
MESYQAVPYRGYYPSKAEPFPLAMAYVPWQIFDTTYTPARGLSNGTIFPELCKPFCGKGGPCA